MFIQKSIISTISKSWARVLEILRCKRFGQFSRFYCSYDCLIYLVAHVSIPLEIEIRRGGNRLLEKPQRLIPRRLDCVVRWFIFHCIILVNYIIVIEPGIFSRIHRTGFLPIYQNPLIHSRLPHFPDNEAPNIANIKQDNNINGTVYQLLLLLRNSNITKQRILSSIFCKFV